MRALTLLLAMGLALAGCAGGDPRVPALQTELAQRDRQIEQLQLRVNELTQSLRAQQAQIQRLQGLGEDRLENVNRVERISLGRHTGGYDADTAAAGSEAVRVYLQPIDTQGNAIKAAGSVTVQVYDLADGPTLLAQCDYPVDQIGQHWTRGLLGSYYVLNCPWTSPPTRRDLTVRVSFVEYLTGKEFSAQKTIEVDLPAPAAE